MSATSSTPIIGPYLGIGIDVFDRLDPCRSYPVAALHPTHPSAVRPPGRMMSAILTRLSEVSGTQFFFIAPQWSQVWGATPTSRRTLEWCLGVASKHESRVSGILVPVGQRVSPRDGFDGRNFAARYDATAGESAPPLFFIPHAAQLHFPYTVWPRGATRHGVVCPINHAKMKNEAPEAMIRVLGRSSLAYINVSQHPTSVIDLVIDVCASQSIPLIIGEGVLATRAIYTRMGVDDVHVG